MGRRKYQRCIVHYVAFLKKKKCYFQLPNSEAEDDVLVKLREKFEIDHGELLVIRAI